MKADWAMRKLGEVCIFDKQQGIYKGLPYVGLEHIESNTGRFIGSMDPIEVKSSTFKFSPKHLLYGRLRPYLNKVMLPDFTGHCSTEIFPLKPNPALLREYLQYWFLMDATVEKIDATSTGARMPRANMNAVLAFELPVPPLAEQQRIVRILDEAFASIATAKANAEKNLQNARALFEAHLEEVFSQRSERWIEKHLGEVCSLITDGKHGDCRNEENSGYYFLSAKDIAQDTLNFDGGRQIKKVDFEETHRRTNLKPNDICMVNTGATIGKLALAPDDPRTFKATFQKSVAVIKPIPSIINNIYCFYHLKADLAKLVNVSSGSAQKNLLLGSLRNHLISMPPIEEQINIVGKITALRKKTQQLECLYQRKLDALDELKKSLLHQAFNGDL